MLEIDLKNPKLLSLIDDSFLDDPLYAYLNDDVERRKELIRIFISLILNCDAGKFYATSINQDVDAAAIWLDLNKSGKKSRWTSFILQLRMLFSGSISNISKIKDPLQLMMDSQEQLYQASDKYLSILCVKASCRNKGMASQLLKPEFEKCDLNNQVCSVDTFNPVNIKIYEGYGFKVINEIKFDTGLVNYQMQRLPMS